LAHLLISSQWHKIRHFNPTTIVFELSTEQAAESRKLIIAITADFDSGRPLLTVNGIVLKPSKTPAHATFYGTPVYASRSFTRGAYRKIPTTYAFSSLQLKEGRNEIVIDVASGTTSDKRSPFLQPSFIYDYVALM
jgi:rhamnogalacturonan endolyase